MAAKPTSALAHQPPDLSSLAITEYAPLPMATVEGANHVVRYVNPAFCRLMDKPSEQLVGKPFCEMLPESDECVMLLDRVFRTENPDSSSRSRTDSERRERLLAGGAMPPLEYNTPKIDPACLPRLRPISLSDWRAFHRAHSSCFCCDDKPGRPICAIANPPETS